MCYNHTQGRDLMKYKNIFIIAFVIILLVVCYFIGESTNEKYSSIDEFSKDEQSELNEIDVDTYLKLKAEKDASVIYFARPTCSHCKVQTPRMKYIKYKYKVEINYVNTDNFSDDDSDYDKVIASDDYFSKNEFGTPLILIVGNGKILSYLSGENTVEDVVTMLSEEGLV